MQSGQQKNWKCHVTPNAHKKFSDQVIKITCNLHRYLICIHIQKIDAAPSDSFSPASSIFSSAKKNKLRFSLSRFRVSPRDGDKKKGINFWKNLINFFQANAFWTAFVSLRHLSFEPLLLLSLAFTTQIRWFIQINYLERLTPGFEISKRNIHSVRNKMMMLSRQNSIKWMSLNSSQISNESCSRKNFKVSRRKICNFTDFEQNSKASPIIDILFSITWDFGTVSDFFFL